MWRALLIFLGLVCVPLLEFFCFPGHSYLQGESQIFVPMIERLNTPGFLSRDLVAISPHLTYTIYDEVTLFLHRLTGQNWEQVLLLQLLASRVAASFGLFFLLLSTRLGAGYSLFLTFLLGLGAALPGVNEMLWEREPLPHAIAFGFVLLALGYLSREKPLLAGLAGGIALVYHAPVAAPFWLLLFLLFFDHKLRYLVRPIVPVFVVFALLLANLAQLQPGVVEPQSFFSHISESWSLLQRQLTPSAWVSTWPGWLIGFYLALTLLATYATVRIWPSLNRQSRWIFLLLPWCGVLSLPFSSVLLDSLRWSLIAQLQPVRLLLFTLVLALAVFGLAGFHAWRVHRPREAYFWFLLLAALPSSTILLRNTPHVPEPAGIEKVAAWAEANTWGGSMFLFPDAGRALYPGIFRARCLRAVYSDWTGRQLARYFETFAREWNHRRQATMRQPYSPQRLLSLRDLPIDYYVLQRRHQLSAPSPVFTTENFVVYDAHELYK